MLGVYEWKLKIETWHQIWMCIRWVCLYTIKQLALVIFHCISVAFDKETYVFHIGSTAQFICDVANIENWTNIYIHDSSDHVYFVLAKNYTLYEEKGVFLSNQSSIAETYARVVLEFEKVPCGIFSDMFTCAVKTDTSWNNDTSTVIFESKHTI